MELKIIADNKNLFVNTYVIYENQSALIIDPGADIEMIESFLSSKNFSNIDIFLTHAHFDHIVHVEQLAKKYNSKVYVYPDDKFMLTDAAANYSKEMQAPLTISEDVNVVEVTDHITFADKDMKIYHVPGHTPGQMILEVKPLNAYFMGDFLFSEGFGRTDLAGGNNAQMIQSLEFAKGLNPKFKIYPGHGPASTMKIAMEQIDSYIYYLSNNQ